MTALLLLLPLLLLPSLLQLAGGTSKTVLSPPYTPSNLMCSGFCSRQHGQV
jgi:hypothetical protein